MYTRLRFMVYKVLNDFCFVLTMVKPPCKIPFLGRVKYLLLFVTIQLSRMM